MSGFFVLFLGNGFNYPGQQIAFRVIEIKKLNKCFFGDRWVGGNGLFDVQGSHVVVRVRGRDAADDLRSA